MKRIFNLAAVTAMMVLTASLGNNTTAQDDGYYDDYENYDDSPRGEVSYQTFYDELSPHGRWIDYPEYGYVWVPNAGPGFRPYSTNGHWVWTDNYEWMWVSDYNWGWAPFHYGRWLMDPYYGWVWVPGYEWSPAWVAWRSGGDYYGWAPIRPGITISIGFSIGSYSPPYDYWCFAPRRYITSPRIYDYCFDRSRNVTIINQTTIINNYNYSSNVWRTGPTRYEAERYTGRITPVRFRESSRPGRTQFRNNEVSIYRPRIQRDESRRFSPRNVERYDRQASNGDGRISRNDNRVERNNDLRTRDNTDTRGNGNNLPRRERTNTGPVERGSNDIRQPRPNTDRNNNAPPVREQRREMRSENGNRPQQMERRAQEPQPQQRQIERPNTDRNSNAPVREQRREMRSDNGNRPQQMERRQQQAQPQQRQMERPQPQQRQVERQQPQPQQRQMERQQPQPQQRQVERQQPQPQQQRQLERRENGGGNSQGNGNGNGRGRGKS